MKASPMKDALPMKKMPKAGFIEMKPVVQAAMAAGNSDDDMPYDELQKVMKYNIKIMSAWRLKTVGRRRARRQ